MLPKRLRPALALALLVPAGCDSNPEGPHAPATARPSASAEGPPARQPVTKNPREIVNPD